MEVSLLLSALALAPSFPFSPTLHFPILAVLVLNLAGDAAVLSAVGQMGLAATRAPAGRRQQPAQEGNFLGFGPGLGKTQRSLIC